MSLLYIDIRFSNSVNEGYSVDTQFCTNNLILKDDRNDHFMNPKIIITFHALNHSSHSIKIILRL